MARYGSEAVARTTQFEHEYAPEQSTRSSFEVVPGGGLDADARRGVSSQFIQRVKLIAVAAALFLTLGVVRIGISTATVSTLQANNVIRNEMRATTATNDSLRVSRSLLASTTRIERIATQNYGMTLETNRPVVDVSNNA
ncbi:MAG: cell division protein FtsL [Atopobium sp.]|uniref:cell division protein FtsL n=1 Tax=Lancefieldella parvula TaxID=1382 RepID=UPI001CAACCAF|nr:cell division protein FtsL [Lancefieldella parvula]MBF0910201.1 cell division protein FtsL [Atopobium sp.]MDU5216873.1 cell division protein FtsL [Atopobium sp.]